MSGSVAAIAVLVLGMVAGTALRGVPEATETVEAFEALGTLWTRALQLTTLPLMVAQVILAVAQARDARAVGRLVWATPVTFVVFLLAAAGFAVVFVPAFIAVLPVERGSLAHLVGANGGSAVAKAAGPAAGAADWMPTNVVQAAAEGQVIVLVAFALAFALALSYVAEPARRSFLDTTRAIAEAMAVIVQWILKATPLGLFALALGIGHETGTEALDAMVMLVVVTSCGLLGFTGLLYGIAAGIGRVDPWRFARAIAPAQWVAVATRSSMASLPAMLASSRKVGLRPEVSDLVLPLSVSAFKVNRTISSTTKLLFVAHLCDIDIAPVALLGFILAVGLISFTIPGIPERVGTNESLPIHVAAGLPAEAVLLFGATKPMTDVFKTLVNVTGDLTVATVLDRLIGRTRGAESPGPTPVESTAA